MSIFYTPDSITSFQQVVINNAHRPIFVTNSANLYNTGATFSRSRGYEKKKCTISSSQLHQKVVELSLITRMPFSEHLLAAPFSLKTLAIMCHA